MDKEFNQYDFEGESSPESPDQERIASEVIHIEQDSDLEGSDALQGGEEPLSEEELAAIKAEEERIKARESKFFWQFISGNWLVLDGITGTYRYLLIVAATLFLSVVTIFYSFHLGAKYTKREAHVQLLHERSLEYQRVRFNKTSHSAIVKELKRRNIQLYDLQESKTIIEK